MAGEIKDGGENEMTGEIKDGGKNERWREKNERWREKNEGWWGKWKLDSFGGPFLSVVFGFLVHFRLKKILHGNFQFILSTS